MAELDAQPPHFRALAPLQGVLHALEATKAPPPELLVELAKSVRSAIEQLEAPDPLRSHMEFVLLSIRTATAIRKVTGINGVVTTKVVVKPSHLPLYNWAVEQVHNLFHIADDEFGEG